MEVSPEDSKLYAAWKVDDIEGLTAALRAGASPSAAMGGMPLIMYAVGNGQIELVSELLYRGADVDAPRHPGEETALMFVTSLARGSAHAELRDLLLNHGADVNARDRGGNSVLDLAVAAERLSDAEALLKRGAKCSATAGVELQRLRSQTHGRDL